MGSWANEGGDLVASLLVELPIWPQGRVLTIQDGRTDTELASFGESLPDCAPVKVVLRNAHYSAVMGDREIPVPADGDCFYHAVLASLGADAGVMKGQFGLPEDASDSEVIRALRGCLADYVLANPQRVSPFLVGPDEPMQEVATPVASQSGADIESQVLSSSRTAVSGPAQQVVAESSRPPVRVAWEESNSAAAQNRELEQAFSTPLPKGQAGQQAALERLRLVSNHLKARSAPDASESQDLLKKLTDPELVVRMRTLASAWEDGKDKVREAAVLGHAQLVGALLKESENSPEQAREVFKTLTKSQKNPSYLNTLATVATTDKSVARALDGILKNLHQQMGADEAAAKEIRTKLLDRPIRSESQHDKYDEEFYGRLFNEGDKKWMEDHAGSRLLARDLNRSALIPTG
ncbi:hypothetical protein CFB82_41040, partial [Burkholderia sp. HI2714]